MSPESPNSRKADSRLPETPWYQRLNLLNTTLLIFMLAVIFSGTQIEGNERDLDVWQNLGRFLADFFPPDLSVVGQTGAALLETVEIAILATFFAIGLSLVIGLGAAQTIAPKWLVVTMRMLLNVIRTIPSLILAVIAVAAMGANALAGVVALTLYSVGYLGKFFSEAFESVDMKVARSLRGDRGGSTTGLPIWNLAPRQATHLESQHLDARIQYPLGQYHRLRRRGRTRSSVACLPGVPSMGSFCHRVDLYPLCGHLTRSSQRAYPPADHSSGLSQPPYFRVSNSHRRI